MADLNPDRSVNCYFCASLVDERDCIGADDYNDNDGGVICGTCVDNPFVTIKALSTKDGFARITLTIGSYVVPNTPEAIERAKDALVDDFSSAVKHWEVEQCLEIEQPIKADTTEVPSWIIEDMEMAQDEG